MKSIKHNLKKACLAVGIIFIGEAGFSQNAGPSGPIPAPQPGVIDGVVLQQHIPTKKVIAYPPLREADYVWSKRIWRTIDLREKINYPLYYPLEPLDDRWALWDILRTNILEGNITLYLPYDPDCLECPADGDQFKYPVTESGRFASEYMEKIKERLNRVEVGDPRDSIAGYDAFGPILAEDENGNVIQIVDTNYFEIEAREVVQYRLKEDWFFDKQRSVLDVRILGIAPVVYRKENDQVVGMDERFWVYFPECRYVFQNYFTYNEKNDARRMSFDDFFWKRKFDSYIHKQTNVYDRKINDYKVGVDALLKSEEIKNDIFIFEHDVWHL